MNIFTILLRHRCQQTVLALAVAMTAVTGAWAATPKYVFLFIGDGMASAQLHAAQAYLSAQAGADTKPRVLAIRSLKSVGLATTHATNGFVTDSAAAATALACGTKTNMGVVGISPDGKTHLRTLAEAAHQAGRAVGIVSSVSLDHATPACFYAHVNSRGNYNEIARQMTTSPFEFFGGGGFKGRIDGKTDAHVTAATTGFAVPKTREALAATSIDERVLASSNVLAGSKALYFEIDRRWLAEHGRTDAERNQMSLADFTSAGIRQLSDDPDGFFMMVEAGKIDWACHANDAMAAVTDTIALDDAVKVALDFATEHPAETLIVVTGDHECGGLTLGYAGTAYASAFKILSGQKVSHEIFRGRMLSEYCTAYEAANPGRRENWTASEFDMDPGIKALIAEAFGLEYETLRPHEQAKLEAAYDATMDTHVETDKAKLANLRELYGRRVRNGKWAGYDPLTVTCTHVLNRRAGICWASYSHTGIPVPVFAQGATAGAFEGYYDNTELSRKIAAAMGVALSN